MPEKGRRFQLCACADAPGPQAGRVQAVRQSLHEVVVGEAATLDRLLTCALTGSHALLVGVPGLAKTLMVKALASAFQWKFARVQFTPDLMPSDITGYELLGRDGQAGAPAMVFRPGPVFANLVLADEINVAAYAVRLCGASRPADGQADPFIKNYVAWGAGPRGSQNLVLAAKAHALLNGRTAPTAADVRAVALPILRHRIIANHRAVGDGVIAQDIVRHLLDKVAA